MRGAGLNLVSKLGLRVWGARFKVKGLGVKVQGFERRVQGIQCRILGAGLDLFRRD